MYYKTQLNSIIAKMEMELQSIENQLAELPSGDLFYKKERGKGTYILRRFVGKMSSHDRKSKCKQKRTSINANEILKEQMLQKEFLTRKRSVLINNIELLRESENLLLNDDFESIIIGLPARCKNMPIIDFEKAVFKTYQLPEPVRDEEVPIKTLAIEYEGADKNTWGKMPYRENTAFLEKKIQKSRNGLYYRSLSEQIIASIYEQKKIPYHYDEVFELTDSLISDGAEYSPRKLISPDFVFINDNGKFIYHEHWGLTDSYQYIKNNIQKLGDYAAAGIVLGINLFVTTNIGKQNLDIEMIETEIDRYMKM